MKADAFRDVPPSDETSVPGSPESDDAAILGLPPRLMSRAVLGPSAVFAALAIGSGELLFWPQLTVAYGAGVIIAAFIAIAIQWTADVEIARYSMATGRSVIQGIAVRWPALGWMLLIGAIVPWAWPGWARVGSDIVSPSVGVSEPVLSVATLLACWLLLALPKRVYGVIEAVQTTLLVMLLAGTIVLFSAVIRFVPLSGQFLAQLVTGHGFAAVLRTATLTDGAQFLALAGGLVFAGAGGSLNLGYGLLICEKGFALGRYSRPIVGLPHSAGLGEGGPPPKLTWTKGTLALWRKWIRLVRSEHLMLFVVTNLVTILCLGFVNYELLRGTATPPQGLLAAVDGALRSTIGSWAGNLYKFVAFLVFFTSELGIIDFAGRIATGTIAGLKGGERLNHSKVYQLVVASIVVLGALLILVADRRAPYWYLVTSGVLNSLVMAMYFIAVLAINSRELARVARAGVLTFAAISFGALIYGGVFLLTAWRILVK